MPPVPLRILPAALLAISVAASCAPTTASRPPATRTAGVRPTDSLAAARAVERVVTDSFFMAITRFDFPQLLRAVTPTFELEEDTLRLSGPGFVDFLRPYVGRATMRYRFEGFNTRVDGTVAWTSYWNRGTFTPTGGQPSELSWLETAVLVWTPEAGWRIDRLHSTPKR